MAIIHKVLIAGLLLTGLSLAKNSKNKWSGDHRSDYRYSERAYPRDYRYDDNYRYNGIYNNRGYYRDYGYSRHKNLPPGIAKKMWRNDYRRRQRQNYWWRGR